MTQPAHMWRYWRDDKGLVLALQDYYPDVLEQDLRLRTALAQIDLAERAINSIMAERACADIDEE